MTSINDLICQRVNPFDPSIESFTPGDFWESEQKSAFTVDSIHQHIILEIESILNQISRDNITRTIILCGDVGSGKSYLLGRLKRTLNDKAFFVYIGPWPDSSFIWRHILRKTVDSLMATPEGKTESQLLLWLKSISVFNFKGFKSWFSTQRGEFIRRLRVQHPRGLYNAQEFFGVLYDLTNPDLYPIACDWLKGDDLDEESLQVLKVKKSIDTEEAAKNILGNLGIVSAETYPIVLCFDQLDSIPNILESNKKEKDLQALFSVNSVIHNQPQIFKKFLIIVSIRTESWNKDKHIISPAALAFGRVNQTLDLKRITIEQAEALWKMRLFPLHQQANPKPESSIYPLKIEQLKELKDCFKGGKTTPRDALTAGYQLYENYKKTLTLDNSELSEHEEDQEENVKPIISVTEAFKNKWELEYKKVQKRIQEPSLLAEPELVKILQEVLKALGIGNIKPKLIRGKYDINSFSYQYQGQKMGIVWTENRNMTSFCCIMKACQEMLQNPAKPCQKFYFIRANNVGNPKTVGNQIYRQIFKNDAHKHIKPTLTSIHYLTTYYELFKKAMAEELILLYQDGGDPEEIEVNLEQLQELIKESQVLNLCPLLQELGVISVYKEPTVPPKPIEIVDPKPPIIPKPIEPVKTKLDDIVLRYMFDRIQKQQIIGIKVLVESILKQFPDLNEQKVYELIEKLCQTKKARILNPDISPEAQLICWIPTSNR